MPNNQALIFLLIISHFLMTLSFIQHSLYFSHTQELSVKQATPLFLYLVEQSLKVTVVIPFQSVTTPKPKLSQLPIRQ